MRSDDKRKLTSRLNALKSTGPKTPVGKFNAAANSRTHGAYAKSLILPGEELADLQLLIDDHRKAWNPTGPIEELLVNEMASTLWRLRRQAPAETAMIHIQIQRMDGALEMEFGTLNANGAYALSVAALHGHSDALSQIQRQGRRLLHQYNQLCRQLQELRQLLPPTAPDPVDLQPQPSEDSTPQAETEEIEPVETKLTGHSPAPHLASENRVANPQSKLYAALPPVPNTQIKAETEHLLTRAA